MGDDDQRARPAVELVLDDGQGVDVEVVGRLVEQQHVGLLEQQPQELQPPPLTAGELPKRVVSLSPVKPEVLQQRAALTSRPPASSVDPAAPFHHIEHPVAQSISSAPD